MKSPTLILASASPRRADLLRQFEFEFLVVPSAVEESSSEDLSAGEVAQLNAYRKARAISKKFPPDVFRIFANLFLSRAVCMRAIFMW